MPMLPKTVLFWVGPDDALLIEQEAVLRFVAYDESKLKLELTMRDGQTIRSFDADRDEWIELTPKLRLKYGGVAVNHNCTPAERGSVYLDDVISTDVRRYKLGGVPIRDPIRFGGCS